MGPGPILARKFKPLRIPGGKFLTRSLSSLAWLAMFCIFAGPGPALAKGATEPALNGWLAVPVIILVLAAGLILQSSLRRLR